MEQSQVKPSNCWMHKPMLEQESSWQVVLGPAGVRAEHSGGSGGEQATDTL